VPRSLYALVGAGTALIACCYGFARFAYGLFTPVFAERFTLNGALTGVIGAGSYVGYCASIVVSLLLTDRIGARRVAVLAGVVATVGLSIVAVAPSAVFLAAGILVAGCSTGLASPPLAAAVAQSLPVQRADRAQTIVNGGTGIGVVASAPIALLMLDHWRAAWGIYAILAAAVTVWVARSIPTTSRPQTPAQAEPSSRTGIFAMVAAALLTGIGSAAVWTFGRDLVIAGIGPTGSTVMWIVIGAAGIAGAFAGDAVERIGLQWAWASATLTMGVATLVLAAAPTVFAATLVAATLFGAAYIALTGLLLLWSTRLYPDRTAFGVGVAFFVIAAGQAVGAPAAGALIDASGARTAFVVIASVGLCALALPTPRADSTAGRRM
jgi:predicted MFS family arabinose efflux permease